MEQIRLDLIPDGSMPVCHASQYDDGRVIRVNLTENGADYTLSDEVITLGVRKGDGCAVTSAIAFESGKKYVDIVTTEQMCAVAGSNLAELKITKNGAIIGTLNFILQVELDPLDEGINSSSKIHDLQAQVDRDVLRAFSTIGAEGLPYDNTESGLTAENVQAAIDEVNAKIEQTPADVYTKSETDALLDAKADKSTTYTKTETDALLDDKADVSALGDYATKSEVNTALSGKADKGDVYTKSQTNSLLAGKVDNDALEDYYTKTEADSLLAGKASKNSVYTKSQTDSALALKANANDVYDKDYMNGIFDQIDNAFTGVNTALGQKANSADVYNKSYIDTALSAKANANAVYTKAETDAKVEALIDDDTTASNKTWSAAKIDEAVDSIENLDFVQQTEFTQRPSDNRIWYSVVTGVYLNSKAEAVDSNYRVAFTNSSYINDTWGTTATANASYNFAVAVKKSDNSDISGLTPDFVKTLVKITKGNTLTETIDALQDDIFGINTTLGNKADNSTVTALSNKLTSVEADVIKPTVLSNNLINPNEIELNGYYAYNTGVWNARNDLCSSGLIPIEKNTQYGLYRGTTIPATQVTYWDGNGSYVSGVDLSLNPLVWTTPNNNTIKYMRVSMYSGSYTNYYLNKGAVDKGYDEYYTGYNFPKDVVSPNITNIENIISKGYDKFAHFSFDDCTFWNDITQNANTYTSIFNNSFLYDLKTLHEQYGAKFSLFCFIEDGVASIADVTNKFADEFKANKDWLRFGFHGTNTTELFTNADADVVKGYYDTFVSAIYTMTGDYDCIDRVTRLSSFTGNLNVCKALRDTNCGISGLLCNDDEGNSYYLSTDQNKYVNARCKFYDATNFICFLKTIKRLESNAITVSDLEGIAIQNRLPIYEFFTHQTQWSGTLKTKLSSFMEWLKENDFAFGYAEYILRL